MATSRCVGFALPLQTGGAGWRRKVEFQVGRRRADEVVWKLGLGQRGCVCQAAARYDSGYKKSDSKRTGGKKPEKYASVAEASGSGRDSRKASRGQKNEVRRLGKWWSFLSSGHAGVRTGICNAWLVFLLLLLPVS
jgi:hypothetical protein